MRRSVVREWIQCSLLCRRGHDRRPTAKRAETRRLQNLPFLVQDVFKLLDSQGVVTVRNGKEPSLRFGVKDHTGMLGDGLASSSCLEIGDATEARTGGANVWRGSVCDRTLGGMLLRRSSVQGVPMVASLQATIPGPRNSTLFLLESFYRQMQRWGLEVAPHLLQQSPGRYASKRTELSNCICQTSAFHAHRSRSCLFGRALAVRPVGAVPRGVRRQDGLHQNGGGFA